MTDRITAVTLFRFDRRGRLYPVSAQPLRLTVIDESGVRFGMYSPRYFIVLMLILSGATMAAHGWALSDGLFLDDHWHRLQYQSSTFSLSALLDATTIKPDRFMESWWQEIPIEWQYVRPVSILVAKTVYHLSGGSVKSLHVLSLVLHLICVMLVHHLTLRLTHRRAWSVVAALLFVVYSHSVFAVGWLAAQNAVLQVTAMLAALLCYVRASGLDLDAGRREEEMTPGGEPPPLNRRFFLLAMLLWMVALGSRENAIVLPVLAAGCDLAFGGRRHLRARWGGLAIMAIVAAAFAYWRLVIAYHPMPDFYVRRPDGPGYPFWCIAKLMHYLTASVWLSPMTVGPSGRFNPWLEVPGDCLLMLAILGVLGTGYYQACRRARGWWIWPMWLLLAVLPVVPVLATPHSGYMPGVGFAVGMVLGPALRDRIHPIGIGKYCKGVAIWFLIATTTYIPIYRIMWQSALASERLTIERVVESPPGPEVSDVFFINLPFGNIYAKLHLQEYWQRETGSLSGGAADGFQCHVLTYAPDVFRMEEACTIRQLDAHRFSVAITGRPYFSGALGRFLIEGMRHGHRFRTGQIVRKADAGFEVEIRRADAEGVHELVFRFDRPLGDPQHAFYVGTRSCAACPLKFRPDDAVEPVPLNPVPLAPGVADWAKEAIRAGEPGAADALFSAMASPLGVDRQEAWRAFREVAGPVAEALAAPIQADFGDQVPDERTLDRIRRWWLADVDERALATLWARQDAFTDLREARDRVYQIRAFAARIIRTDLYLTGPPFPGPR